MNAPEGLVTSVGYSCNKEVYYVFEGNIHCTGDTLNWLKIDVGRITSYNVCYTKLLR